MTHGHPSLRFPRSSRLAHDLDFQAVFDAQVRKAVGPLVVYGRPNGLPHPRLGLTVSRRVGGAVVRNRVKRLLREAFRLDRHAWAGAYDLVVVVRPHRVLPLARYRELLSGAAGSIHEQWTRARPPQHDRPSPPASA